MPQQQQVALTGQTLFTISALAREFRVDRATVKRALDGIPPTGRVEGFGGHDGWSLDAIATLRGRQDPAAPAPEQKIRPIDQDKFYAAQLKKLQLERETGQVVRVAEVKAAWIEVVKKLVSWAESLADQLERAAGLTPKQVEQLERRIDEMRGDLHADLARRERDE